MRIHATKQMERHCFPSRLYIGWALSEVCLEKLPRFPRWWRTDAVSRRLDSRPGAISRSNPGNNSFTSKMHVVRTSAHACRPHCSTASRPVVMFSRPSAQQTLPKQRNFRTGVDQNSGRCAADAHLDPWMSAGCKVGRGKPLAAISCKFPGSVWQPLRDGGLERRHFVSSFIQDLLTSVSAGRSHGFACDRNRVKI